MTDKFETFSDPGLDQKTSDSLDIFWLGVILYTASFALATTTVVNYVFCQLTQIVAILLFVPAAIRLIQWKFDSNYLSILLFTYCIWQLAVIFRGVSFTYDDVKDKLFDVDLGIFRFFVPLVILFPKNVVYYKKLFTAIVILGVLFIGYDIIFRDNLLNLDYENNNTKFTFEHFTKLLSVPSGFILLTFPYHSKSRKFIAAFVVALSIAFAVIRARRSLIFMNMLPVVFSFMFYLYAGKRKLLTIFLTILVGSSLIIYGIKLNNENPNGVFSLLTDRMYEDTRSNVEECLYYDMSTVDWIIGRGMNGKYLCPGIDIDDQTGYRSMIETDYLNIILKGGIISLALILLILIPAIIQGIFYSNNLLSKAAAIWILLWVIELYPTNVYSFSVNHILVWICAGICYSKPIRLMPENELVKILST